MGALQYQIQYIIIIIIIKPDNRDQSIVSHHVVYHTQYNISIQC
jgi:hypothetical protein